MSLSNLLRRALVHYSRCSGALTLPPVDLEAQKPNWAQTLEPFYEEDSFHPLTVQDPAYVLVPVLVQKQEDQTVCLICEETGKQYMGEGLVFADIPDDGGHGQLMESWEKDRLRVTVVVPDAVFDMVQPLSSRYDQFDALCDYCLLSEEAKTAVKKFLTDPKAAAGLFYCLCFLSSRLTGTNLELEMLNIPALTEEFNRTFVCRLGVAFVDPEEVKALIHSLKISSLPRGDDLYHILTFCAILNRCSRVQEYDERLIYAMYRFSEDYGMRTDFLLQWCCDGAVLGKQTRPFSATDRSWPAP